MALPSIATAEDWSNAPDIRNTFERSAVDPVKSVDEQARWASTEEALGGPATELPAAGNRQALPMATELRQVRPTLVRVREWPEVNEDRPRTATFHARQEWEGYVVAINGKEFTARLVDLTGGGTYEEEEAQIPLEEVSEADQAKMQPGSIFRWVIGFKRSAMGQKERISSIVFRDLPAVSRSDEQAGKAWAKKILASFEE